MKKQKLLALVLAVLMVSLSLTACAPKEGTPAGGQTDGEKITLVMWHTLTDQHEEVLKKITDDFNNSQDKYVMTLEQQPYSEIDAKTMQAVRNGTGPDVGSLFPSLAIQYITEGLLADFLPYIDDPEIGIPNFRDNVMPGTFAENTQWGGDEMYLFPVTSTGEVLFYNKTMFDEMGIEPPKTWSDVEAYSKRIYAEQGIPGFGTDSVTDTYLCLIRQAGSPYIDAASKSMAMDKGIAVEKLNWFADGVKGGYFRLVGEDMYFSNPFGSGAVASYIGSSAGVSYVYAGVGDKFEVGCVPIPQEGGTKYISSWNSGYVCYSTDEEKIKGAYEYLKFCTTVDPLLEWAEGFGSVPYYFDALETERFQALADTNIAIKALAEELPYVGYLSSILGADSVRTHVDEMVQSVALGLSDAETAFEAFVAASNNALNK